MSTLKNVAIVGATGAVGAEMIRCLEERKFPVGQLTLLASARSAGKKLKFKGEDITIQELTPDSFKGIDIALFNAAGRNVWESGYVDSHGDMADLHSADVLAGKLPDDTQLFNLQTKFLTTNVKGTDREMYLPINLDIDQLPFIRPSGVPTSVLNHPPFVRMEGRSLPPLSQRDATYTIPAAALKDPGRYRLSIRMRSRAEPMYFMDFIGSTPEMDQAMDEWMINLHESSAEFTVAPAPGKQP